MSRAFTDAYGRRWHVDTHRADDGRLEFTARPRRGMRTGMRFIVSVLTIDALVYLVVATLAEGHEALNPSISAAVTGLLIGTVASGLVFGLSALLRRRTYSDPLVFSAPFPLRPDLSDAELSRAVEAAEQMHLHPDHTGPIDVRAIVARSLRDEKPASRLAR